MLGGAGARARFASRTDVPAAEAALHAEDDARAAAALAADQPPPSAPPQHKACPIRERDVMTMLDPAFARELEALRRRLQRARALGRRGDHVAKRRGSSAEFLEHRPYAPGDDLRRIDWLAFARTGEPVFKLFRAEEDVVVRLVVDASASLEAGDAVRSSRPQSASPRHRLHGARRLGARAGDGRERRPHVHLRADARARRAAEAPPRARSHRLEERDGSLAGDRQAMLRSPRPGMLVVISDFFDPGPFDAALTRAAAAGHDVALVQVLSPDEIEPHYDGDYALEDAETGAVVEVTVDAGALEAYLARLNQLVLGLRALAKKIRGTYVAP